MSLLCVAVAVVAVAETVGFLSPMPVRSPLLRPSLLVARVAFIVLVPGCHCGYFVGLRYARRKFANIESRIIKTILLPKHILK